MRWYVYYKVPEAAVDAAVVAAQALQRDLSAAHPGLRCALLRRPELREGQLTLMEAYAGTLPADFERRLAEAAAARTGLPPGRHTECFIPLGRPRDPQP